MIGDPEPAHRLPRCPAVEFGRIAVAEQLGRKAVTASERLDLDTVQMHAVDDDAGDQAR